VHVKLIFKLVEDGSSALALLLPVASSGFCVLGLAFGLGCMLVEAFFTSCFFGCAFF
jgi:hypothetical protein